MRCDEERTVGRVDTETVDVNRTGIIWGETLDLPRRVVACTAAERKCSE
jgi:hypothetical protein